LSSALYSSPIEELGDNMGRFVSSRLKKAFLVATLVAVVLVPVAVFAAGSFTDTVGNTFEADIEWMAQSGITTGCGGGKFCPDSNVTRGQMSAFMRRFSKYIDAEDGTPSSIDGDIVMSYPPSAWHASDGGPTDGGGFDGFLLSDLAILALTGPQQIGEVTYGIASVTFCFEAETGEGLSDVYLDSVVGLDVYALESVGPATGVGCQTITTTPFAGGSYSLSVASTPVANPSLPVLLMQTTAVWSPTTALPTDLSVILSAKSSR
jgi:hypothetical protein